MKEKEKGGYGVHNEWYKRGERGKVWKIRKRNF
jgi:hypothetical protein